MLAKSLGCKSQNKIQMFGHVFGKEIECYVDICGALFVHTGLTGAGAEEEAEALQDSARQEGKTEVLMTRC